MTNVKRTATLLGVVLLFGTALQAQAATPRVIGNSQTVYCTGRSVSGEINYDGTETVGAYRNTVPIIDMRSGATLVVTADATLCAGLIVTSGTATVYMQTGAAPTFLRHVIVRESGKLILKNCTSAVFGSLDTYATAKCHFYDVKNIAFAKSSGTQQNGTVTFGFARVLAFPTAENGVTVAPDLARKTSLYLAAESDYFMGQSDIAVSNYTQRLVVQTPKAILAHTTVTVNEGCSFGVLPAATYDTSVANLVEHSLDRVGDDDFTGLSSFAFAGGIAFEASTSILSNDFAWASALSFTGKISGEGQAFTHVRGGDVSAGKVTTHAFSNVAGFTGSWAVSGDPAVANGGALCQMAAGSSATLPNATVVIGAGGGLVGKSGVTYASAGKIRGEDARQAIVQVAGGQTMTVTASSGAFAAVGSGASSSTLDITACSGPTVIADNGTVSLRLNGGPLRGGARAEAYDTSSNFACYALPDAEGTVDLATLQKAMAGYPYLGITADDGSILKGVTGATTLCTDEGAQVTVTANGGVDLTVRGNGAVTLQDTTAAEGAWTNAVTYWYDFSLTNTYRRPTELSYLYGRDVIPELQKATLKYNRKDYPSFCGVVDWRYPDSPNRLWNNYWETTTDTVDHRNAYTNQVIPCYVPGTRTRTYMAVPTGNARRLPFCTTDKGNGNGDPTAVEEIIMIFSAADGGGHALVATDEAAFGRRNEKSCPFMTNNTYGVTMRVNGEEIDPSETGPSGGWQMLTIGMNGLKFKGLGFLRHTSNDGDGWGKHNGGQRYGEILIFREKLDEISRLEAEMSLATKWKLTYPRKAEAEAYITAHRWASVTNRVTASGTGTIVGGGRTLEVSGDFAGTLELNGDKMRISESASPYTEDQIPSENRVWWSDPSLTNTLTLATAKSTQSGEPVLSNAVRAVADRASGLAVGKTFLWGVGNRMPFLVEAAHGYGPSMPWLDYYDYEDPAHTATSRGNNLRFNDFVSTNKMIAGSDDSRKRSKFAIHTAFVVQDFSRGGYGNTLLDHVEGKNLTVRTGGRTDPIWKGTCWQFADGETRLNGRTVNQADGVSALPEVLTLRAQEAYKSSTGWFYGAYQTSEKSTHGEMFGEMLLYSAALSDADVKGIEGYLMKKWLGTLPPGLSDLSQTTISGKGELTVDASSLLPQFSDAFAGTLTVEGSQLTRTMLIDPETGVVSGALNVPNATLVLPSSCTLNVDFSGTLLGSIAERRYALVNCTKTNVKATDWIINLGAQVPQAWAHIEITGNLIELVVDPAGFMIMVK